MVVWAVCLTALWLRGRMQHGGGLHFSRVISATLSGCSISNNTAGLVSGALRFPAATASFAHALPLSAAARCAALPLAARLAGRGVWRQLGGLRTSATRRGVRLGGLLRVGEVEWGACGA